jgi:hypothetical protein
LEERGALRVISDFKHMQQIVKMCEEKQQVVLSKTDRIEKEKKNNNIVIF